MNPVLTQIIEHPEFGSVLPQAVAFAALGTNDRSVSAFRKAGKLIEGEHFVRVPQRAGMPKLHWTVVGLQALAIALNTDRAKSFHADLLQWLQTRPNTAAMQHQPRGYAVPPTMASAYVDYEPVSLQPWQQSEPLTATHYQEQPAASSHYSLAELEAMKAIAQSERDSQMLALLDKAITTLAVNQPTQSQPVERVVYVQPQKTTHINFLWNWQGGSNNHSNGSLEVIFGLMLVVALFCGLVAAMATGQNRPTIVYPPSSIRGINAE